MLNTEDYSSVKKNDRILVLEAGEGGVKDSAGFMDKRLFTGGNNLHAVKEEASNLWYFKYDNGVLPEPLRDKKYTTFKHAKEVAELYFGKRNVRIKEVID